ncbi:ANTAR domain-containing protein [Mycobacterium sp. E2733]|uniref:ANTAR domain-containing protein n=1 Tax=Mycobacterium sp. E2733 TaxID=1834138 RepID=UPI000B15BC81|nr:ANTAR domain-containing protein [Mycobacterium sp. E2733]
MADSANSSHVWPGDVIAQATDIISERFKLDAAQSLAVLRTMSRNTRMQMCVVAEHVINRELPAEAVRGLGTDVSGFASPQRRNHGFNGLRIVAD